MVLGKNRGARALKRCKINKAEMRTALHTDASPPPLEWRLVAVVVTDPVSFSEQLRRDGADKAFLQAVGVQQASCLAHR